jgi:siroheme synthase
MAPQQCHVVDRHGPDHDVRVVVEDGRRVEQRGVQGGLRECLSHVQHDAFGSPALGQIVVHQGN